MPLVNVKVIEGVFTPAQKQEMIRKLTDTMVEIEGESMRPVSSKRSRAATGGSGAIRSPPAMCWNSQPADPGKSANHRGSRPRRAALALQDDQNLAIAPRHGLSPLISAAPLSALEMTIECASAIMTSCHNTSNSFSACLPSRNTSI